jgi:hypothetical protein
MSILVVVKILIDEKVLSLSLARAWVKTALLPPEMFLHFFELMLFGFRCHLLSLMFLSFCDDTNCAKLV